jgi:hypothetical protein
MRSSAGIFQAGHVAAHLAAHELLVDAELANAAEHAGEGEQHAPDVVGGVHVSGVEAGDHRVQPLLLFRCERTVLHRDVRIGEAVVVQRCVRVQVVGRRVVPGHTMAPLLLQRDTEERATAHLVAHDGLHVELRGEALRDVVRQEEVASWKRLLSTAGAAGFPPCFLTCAASGRVESTRPMRRTCLFVGSKE